MFSNFAYRGCITRYAPEITMSMEISMLSQGLSISSRLMMVLINLYTPAMTRATLISILVANVVTIGSTRSNAPIASRNMPSVRKVLQNLFTISAIFFTPLLSTVNRPRALLCFIAGRYRKSTCVLYLCAYKSGEHIFL